MFCSKCGFEIEDMMKFCPCCGEKIENHNDSSNSFTVNSEKIKDDIFTNEKNDSIDETEQDTTSSEEAKLSYAPDSSKQSESNEYLKNYSSYSTPQYAGNPKNEKKTNQLWKRLSVSSKIIVILICIIFLFLLISLFLSKVGGIIISLIQLVLLTFSLLSNQNIINVKSKWFKIATGFIAGILVIPFFSTFFANKDIKTISWSEIVLGNIIPEPASHKAEIITNSSHSLSINIYDTSSKEYYEYISECKGNAFTVDAEEDDNSYNAFNHEGYHLNLNYDDDDDKMTIDLDEPRSFDSYVWPTSGFATLLPKPKSSVGDITENTEERFDILVGESSFDDYTDYVNQCKALGYTVDIFKDKKSFSAKNTDGYKLNVSYIGYNAMQICLEIPEYSVNLTVKCTENLIFSKYDIDVLVDDSSEGKVDHGSSETFDLLLKKGKHKISIQSCEDSTIDGSITLDITKNGSITLVVSCSSTGITIKSDVEQKQQDSSEPKTNETTKEATSQKETTVAKTKAPESVYYSTNDSDTVKNGNTGKYAYKSRGGTYSNYYIIDFDDKYVYWFSEGNGDTTCDRLKIESGDLNNGLIITYHDGSDVWSESLHFKYYEHPDHLIMQDKNGFDYDFYPTNIYQALNLKGQKTVYDY